MDRKLLDDLFRHLDWADARVWEAILAGEAARADERTLTWLHHIHTVQWAFLLVWREEPVKLPELAEFDGPEAVARWGREGIAAATAFLEGASPGTLDRELRVPWADRLSAAWGGSVEHPTLAETALQVAMHSLHHRGQVAARLRALGGEPPLADFIAWLWWGRPRPSWGFLDPSNR